MGYLIAGVGAFLTLLVWLWKRSVRQQDDIIDDLTSHLEEERKKLYVIIERKNAYIRQLEDKVLEHSDPSDVLNELFSSGKQQN